MFNRRLKELSKEARVLLALSKSCLDNQDVSAAQEYIDLAMAKLCEADKQNGEKICATVKFVDKCLDDINVDKVMGEDFLSLAKLVGRLRIQEKPQDKEMEGFFYGQQGE